MSRKILSDQDYGSASRLLNLLDAVDPQEPATLAQLRAAIQGLNWKDACRVASTANVNISSPGSSIDGISLNTNDRVLLKDQSTANQNGPYIWNGAAVAMTRAEDGDSAVELEGAVVTIEEGTANAKTTWRLDTVNFTLGTTSLVWSAFGTATPDASTTVKGITETATQAEVDTGTDPLRYVTPETLKAWANAKKVHAATIGDGSATQIDVTHNFGTRDLTVMVRLNSGTYATVECDIEMPDANTVRLKFAVAPASNALRVIILG